MHWQQALLWSKCGKAYRLPDVHLVNTDIDAASARPQFVERRQEGPTQWHVCRSFDGAQLHMSEAERFHDWQPTDPVDAITALGNVERDVPVWAQPRQDEPRAGPLEAYLDEHP